MMREEARPKMRVFFGRTHGEQTLGEIVKCNPTRARVRTLEQRGEGCGGFIGSEWNVPYSMMTPADADAKTGGSPAPTKREPLKYNPFLPYEDQCILQAIGTIYI